MPTWTPQRLRDWHENLTELLIENPDLTYEQLAVAMQVHPQSIKLVVTSDLFQLALKERRAPGFIRQSLEKIILRCQTRRQ
jgi:hypothetical protein